MLCGIWNVECEMWAAQRKLTTESQRHGDGGSPKDGIAPAGDVVMPNVCRQFRLSANIYFWSPRSKQLCLPHDSCGLAPLFLFSSIAGIQVTVSATSPPLVGDIIQQDLIVNVVTCSLNGNPCCIVGTQ